MNKVMGQGPAPSPNARRTNQRDLPLSARSREATKSALPGVADAAGRRVPSRVLTLSPRSRSAPTARPSEKVGGRCATALAVIQVMHQGGLTSRGRTVSSGRRGRRASDDFHRLFKLMKVPALFDGRNMSLRRDAPITRPVEPPTRGKFVALPMRGCVERNTRECFGREPARLPPLCALRTKRLGRRGPRPQRPP
jgi:hypothetical protein